MSSASASTLSRAFAGWPHALPRPDPEVRDTERAQTAVGFGHACHLEQPDEFLGVVQPFLCAGPDEEGADQSASPMARRMP